MASDLYDPSTDDPSFNDLIRAGLVLDETGKVKLTPPTEEELLKVVHCQTLGLSSMSGRGYFHVWKSSMQKAIRRCKVEDTLVAVVECCNLTGMFVSNIVNRLAKVVVCEDVGPANPRLAVECRKFVSDYEGAKCKAGERLSLDLQRRLLDLAYHMTVSRKSRLVCNMLCAIKLPSPLPDSATSFSQLQHDLFHDDLEGAVRSAVACEKSKTLCSTVEVAGLKRRRSVYRVWSFLLDESEIDPELKEITWSLLMLYDRAGEEASLLLTGAVTNIVLWGKIKEKGKKVGDCPYSMGGARGHGEVSDVGGLRQAHAGNPWESRPWEHVLRSRMKISNRHPAIEKLDDLYYGRCVGRSDFHL